MRKNHFRCKTCRKARDHEYYLENRDHKIAMVSRWQELNPELTAEIQSRAQTRRRLESYGLTPEGYQKKILSQHGLCLLCKYPLFLDDKKSFMRPVLDHDHSLKGEKRVLRGILHHSCNLLLTEKVCSRPSILLEAIAYLKGSTTEIAYKANAHGANARYYADYLQAIERLLEDQRRSCKICGSEFTADKVRNQFGIFESRSFDVDHGEYTGLVRGLLCRPCNLLLGNARENRYILASAYSYLTPS